MVLHARETAVPFYLKLGYEVVGGQFEEVGIPHFKMEKKLS
jgi:predicted GNAT family N-acyltransferase